MAARSPADASGNQVKLFSARVANKTLSPKRPSFETAGMADVFPYYAGFSFEWAKNELTFETDSTPPTVLDPWNGSGTTTLAARTNGLKSIGVDLNPVANIVAQLRVQVGHAAQKCEPPATLTANYETQSEPLLAWLSARGASRARAWAISLDSLPQSVSSLGYVALFRVIRRLTKQFEGSNPTWVRRASRDHPVVDLDPRDLDACIMDEQTALLERLGTELHHGSPAAIITASSTALPLGDRSIDLVLTSPPYMTRIDYAVAYARELAIFGIDIASDRHLREELMGTTLIRRRPNVEGRKYASIATALADKVSSHESKASSGYYLKQVCQYLDDLVASFDEITRVSKDRAVMKMVVQDSYYKDIPIRLADICTEEAKQRGWKADDPDQFPVSRHLTQLNTPARAYLKGQVVETVMTFRKGY
jgi:hypothetical protein